MDKDQVLHRLQMVINAAHEAALQIQTQYGDGRRDAFVGIRISTPHGPVVITEDGDVAVNPSHHCGKRR